jgi:hypothetical protein
MTAPAQPARDLAWAVAEARKELARPHDPAFGVEVDPRALRLLLGAAEDAGRLDYLLTGHGQAVVGPPDHPYSVQVRSREDIDAAMSFNSPERVALRAARAAGAGEGREP